MAPVKKTTKKAAPASKPAKAPVSKPAKVAPKAKEAPARVAKPGKPAARRSPAAPAAPAPAQGPVMQAAPTSGAVVAALFGRDSARLAAAVGDVDFERAARYLLGLDWSAGHFSRFRWDMVCKPLDARELSACRDKIQSAHARGDVKELARVLRGIDWGKLLANAPAGDLNWTAEVLELAVEVYNQEKTETVCPRCPYPYRDLFARMFRMEREVSGRVVPLACPFEGDGRQCPPDLSADSWTRIDDLTGQDGRSVQSHGLSDFCITSTKIGFDISDVPEGGGCVVMKERERERIHAQRSGRIPAEPVPSNGKLVVYVSGFSPRDDIQVVAAGSYSRDDGPRHPVVVDWEVNDPRSQIAFTVYDETGELISGNDVLVTIDWIATTR